MVDGSVACATITTSSLDKSASDAKKNVTTRTSLESLSTSEKLKTRKPRSSLQNFPASTYLQDQNSNNTTTECLRPNLTDKRAITNKELWCNRIKFLKVSSTSSQWWAEACRCRCLQRCSSNSNSSKWCLLTNSRCRCNSTISSPPCNSSRIRWTWTCKDRVNINKTLASNHNKLAQHLLRCSLHYQCRCKLIEKTWFELVRAIMLYYSLPFITFYNFIQVLCKFVILIYFKNYQFHQ